MARAPRARRFPIGRLSRAFFASTAAVPPRRRAPPFGQISGPQSAAPPLPKPHGGAHGPSPVAGGRRLVAGRSSRSPSPPDGSSDLVIRLPRGAWDPNGLVPPAVYNHVWCCSILGCAKICYTRDAFVCHYRHRHPVHEVYLPVKCKRCYNRFRSLESLRKHKAAGHIGHVPVALAAWVFKDEKIAGLDLCPMEIDILARAGYELPLDLMKDHE